MSYLTVITLDQAKTYLRVDDTLTEDDNQITMMINASLSMVERYTQNYVYKREEEFTVLDGNGRIYAHPVNSVVDPVDTVVKNVGLYSWYSHGSDTFTLTLDVGWENVEDVPAELIEVGFETIREMYYEGSNSLSDLSKQALAKHMRFLI